MSKILVTGGAGYIGSHTLLLLIEAGYEVVCVDNLVNSTLKSLDQIEKITGKKIPFHHLDLSLREPTLEFFSRQCIDGIIHFAALKSVPESVANPELYYRNNIDSTKNIIESCKLFNINKLVFSSSCSVYGDTSENPVTEKTTLRPAKSPYGETKQICESLIVESDLPYCSLRYFNPAGGHPSAMLGEFPANSPANLVPAICNAAQSSIPMKLFGDQYNTPDGTCLRDYVHVLDIADAHIKALEYMDIIPKSLFNLGMGRGVSVMEMIKAFEQVNGLVVPYEILPARAGDVESIYANIDLAKKELKWHPKYSIADIMSTAWKWQKTLETLS